MKQIKIILIIFLLNISNSYSNTDINFLKWKSEFKKIALANNISEKTFDMTMVNVKFLPNVIKYDRYQPEFYEDTKTYIQKRTSKKKLNKGISFYSENNELINVIEKKQAIIV